MQCKQLLHSKARDSSATKNCSPVRDSKSSERLLSRLIIQRKDSCRASVSDELIARSVPLPSPRACCCSLLRDGVHLAVVEAEDAQEDDPKAHSWYEHDAQD